MGFGFACFKARWYRERDLLKSQRAYELGVAYYRYIMAERQKELGVTYWMTHDKRDVTLGKRRLAEKYKSLWLPYIARIFEQQARGDYLGYIW
jgi:hypothetical protein